MMLQTTLPGHLQYELLFAPCSQPLKCSTDMPKSQSQVAKSTICTSLLAYVRMSGNIFFSVKTH